MKRITPKKLQAAYKFVGFHPTDKKFYDAKTNCGCPITAIACHVEGLRYPPQEYVTKEEVGTWAIDTLTKYNYKKDYLRAFWHYVDGLSKFVNTLAQKDALLCIPLNKFI